MDVLLLVLQYIWFQLYFFQNKIILSRCNCILLLYADYCLFLQKQLAQIKAWSEEMNKFTVSFCTTNGLLMVDCSGIRDSIIPKLSAIFRQLTKMVTKDLLRLSKDFISKVNELVEV